MSEAPFTISLKRDVVFQKFLAKAILRECEVFFNTLDGESSVGFVTGLDNEWVQISSKERSVDGEYRSVLVQIVAIASFGETGQKLYKLDEKIQQDVHKWANVITNVSRTALATS